MSALFKSGNMSPHSKSTLGFDLRDCSWLSPRDARDPRTFCCLKNAVVLFIAFCITSCITVLRHEFSDPTVGWQTKSGQLMYRSAKTTLIGDALVRFSKTGDFELTVSKGPGITLLSLRQDAAFAEVKGGFARQSWSGPVERAPLQLLGWLALRNQFLHAPNQKIMRYTAGNETFLFRF